MKKDAKAKIKALIDKYELAATTGKVRRYTEEETKNVFIKPLFEALGWDFSEKEEVSAEESIISSGRVDYGFYINDRPKFYLEAKKLKVDLNIEGFARQAIRYSFNRGVTWAILTDFESIKVFNAQALSNYLGDKLYFEIKYSEYLDRFDQLWLLSKESFSSDSIDKEAEKAGKKLQRVPITELLFKDLNDCRRILTEYLGKWNPKVPKDLLDEGVQKLLDRLIFIRVAEDRKIEHNILTPLISQWRATTGKNKPELYESMRIKFRELDDIYNSNLFSPHPFEQWEDDGGALEKVINILHGKEGYYEYDFSIMPADILGGVYENYLGYKLSQSEKGLTLDKAAGKRKEQGIYYTPTFIVDYIVRNALKPVLDRCKSVNDLMKIKVLDPACGSGSFLIKALDVINEKYKEFGYEGNEFTKIQIILQNLYGVDLDEQAVEIARLNLLINTLEERGKLPSLDQNIKNGNSLISGTDEVLEKYFGKNYREKKPFNWNEEFPEVFKQGGFDVIIGNPPYVGVREQDASMRQFIKDNFNFSSGADLYVVFIDKSLQLLKKEGYLAFICPNKFFGADYGEKIRKLLKDGKYQIRKIWDLKDEKVFKDAMISTVVIIIQKSDRSEKIILKKGDSEKIVENLFDEAGRIQIDANSESKIIIEKINKNNKLTSLAKIRTGIMGFEYWKMQAIISNKKVLNTVKLYVNGNMGRYQDLWSKEVNLFKNKYSTIYMILDERYLNKNTITLFKDKPKILIRGVAKNLSGIIDFEGSGALVAVHALIPKDGENIFYILGLINSRILNWYHLNVFYSIRIPQGSLKYPINFLNSIPIPEKNTYVQKEIEKNVQKILNLYKDLKNVEENSNKWNMIKEEIDKTDKKIDEEVYKLYGLTKEEIKIVEENARN